jgi:hypothetical protein
MLVYVIAAVLVVIVLVASTLYLRAVPETFGALVSTKASGGLSASGTVEKYHTDKGFVYVYHYNLPINNPPFQVVSKSVAFNAPVTYSHYKVYLGESKGEMNYVGVLHRDGDGFHKLVYNCDKDYKFTCITFNDSFVNCSEF